MNETAGIYALKSGYLDRYVQVGIAQGRVISVSFPTGLEENVSEEHELLDRIEAYLQGQSDSFEDVEVAMTMPTPQRTVLEAVRKIPYGENASVEQISHLAPDLAGDEAEKQRSIREALAENPVPIFIPTHRVRDGPGGAPPEVESKLRAIEGL